VKIKMEKKIQGTTKKSDLKPKHFRGSSLDVREAEAERKRKEEKERATHSPPSSPGLEPGTPNHARSDSIGIDALMKTLGTDELFAIHVGGQGRQRGSSSSDQRGGPPSPYKPTIGLGLSSLSEGDETRVTTSSTNNSPLNQPSTNVQE